MATIIQQFGPFLAAVLATCAAIYAASNNRRLAKWELAIKVQQAKIDWLMKALEILHRAEVHAGWSQYVTFAHGQQGSEMLAMTEYTKGVESCLNSVQLAVATARPYMDPARGADAYRVLNLLLGIQFVPSTNGPDEDFGDLIADLVPEIRGHVDTLELLIRQEIEVAYARQQKTVE
jgi:hypothetical protein